MTNKKSRARNHGTIWDEKDFKELVEYYTKDMEYNDIANHLGRSTGSVMTKIAVLRQAYKMRSFVNDLAPIMVPRERKKAEKNSTYVPEKESSYEGITKDNFEVKEPEKKQLKIPEFTSYDDNEEGAKTFLACETTLVPSVMTKYYADPSVEGVWKATNVMFNKMLVDCVMYMGGYPDTLGTLRTCNDFETVEIT